MVGSLTGFGFTPTIPVARGPSSKDFRSSQCSTTGVTKAVVCVILSVGWCI